MNEPIVRTEPLGGSVLSQAGRAGQLPQWYRPVPRDGSDWRQYARDVADSVPKTWFSDLEQAMAPRGAAAARLERSADARGLVITTGQQPGLFGGPLMTFAKAITARAIADALEELLQLPVAPVFWAATDDADFDEAAVVSVALDGGARELRLDRHAPAGTPMSRAAIGHDVDDLIPFLRDACGSIAHASYVDIVTSAYRAGTTVGDAYVAVLREVLEPLEIAVLDVSHASVIRTAAPLMRRVANAGEPLAGVVRRRNEEITAAGFSPQVDEVPGMSLVFLNREGSKRRVPVQEAAQIRALPDGQFLSATVLLRPVLERALLPTAAYVGGPGEIAYFAQVTAVADALGVPTPLVLPRWSTTIVEPRIQRILTEFGAAPGDFADPHAVEGRVARDRLSPETGRALQALRDDVSARVDSLEAVSGSLVSRAVVDGLRRSVGHQISRLERRIYAAVKRREDDVMHRLATARGSLYPHGTRQERKLAFAPFLARYGPQLVEQMLEAARVHARAIVSGSPSIAAPRVQASARV